MKTFFKYVLATMTGIFLLFFVFLIVISIIIGAAGSKSDVKVEKNSILMMPLNYAINDKGVEPSFDPMDFESFELEPSPGLNDILRSINNAKIDDRIDGIYLKMEGLQSGIATIDEIRDALIDFKTSGKFVYAYSEQYTGKSYYLASVADSIFINPEGGLEWMGISAELMFIKGALEKLGIEPQVIRYGKFKSAVEPYTREDMSESNEEQIAEVLDDIWLSTITNISKERNVPVEKLQELADQLLIRKPADALEYGLVDKLVYKDELIDMMLEKMDVEEEKDLNLIKLSSYKDAKLPKSKKFSKEKIAVIYAMGGISSGSGGADEIRSETVSRMIRKARLDEKIKAIVFRVNSGGGSALASDVIWREAKLAGEEKPFIVSMGNVAASGGYYISCSADTILAGENTITGSIGVFGLLFNAQEFFNDKLGLTFDTYATGAHAGMGTPTRPLTDYEKEVIQEYVDNIYKTFTEKVADGRGITAAEVDSVGQGRIWSGADAKRLGLVDINGGLMDAIQIAADKAGLENYRLTELPESQSPIEKIMKDFNSSYKTKIMKEELGPAYKYYKSMQEMTKLEGILARMPFDIIFN